MNKPIAIDDSDEFDADEFQENDIHVEKFLALHPGRDGRNGPIYKTTYEEGIKINGFVFENILDNENNEKDNLNESNHIDNLNHNSNVFNKVLVPEKSTISSLKKYFFLIIISFYGFKVERNQILKFTFLLKKQVQFNFISLYQKTFK